MFEKPIITLTTDFGLKDPFVGIMKGVIMEINPTAQIVDISHNISPHNIFEAAQVIKMSYKYFPSATIHIVVVDPQVGGGRKPLLIVTDDYYFIGPDNGSFTAVLEEQHTDSVFKVMQINAEHYFRSQKGSSFHGRDIFAPVGAWLSKGIESTKFGEQIRNYHMLQLPGITSLGENAFEGEVVHVDVFGNAMTNLSYEALVKLNSNIEDKRIEVTYKGSKADFVNYYSEKNVSSLASLINSSGYFELFVYHGNASEKYGLKVGDKISVAAV